MSQFRFKSAGEIATLACLLEVSASKPGNVHRGADFEDVGMVDFLVSGVALGHAIDVGDRSFGATVLDAVDRTKIVAGTNTNLGIVLLLVPLAGLYTNWIRDPAQSEFNPSGMSRWLQSLTPQDCADVFQAINNANPGGLGSSDQMDVRHGVSADGCLLEAMRLAKDRDRIAAEYTDGFRLAFDRVSPLIVSVRDRFETLSQAIVFAHVSLMAEFPDSLIARKCGEEIALQSSVQARRAVDALDESPEQFWSAASDLDFWLRSDGHRRNPGTTADLIAAGLFIGLANGSLKAPFR